MFRFDFSNENNREHISNTEDAPNIAWLQAEEIVINDDIFAPEYKSNYEYNIFNCSSLPDIKYVSTNCIVKYLKRKCSDNTILHAEQNHSDLITGVYEGGLKIWECTKDLADFICNEKINLKNKYVLDLGCGAGIIGILSLFNGAYVYFQDYNREVITSITIPNVNLNLENDQIIAKSKFYSGDWESFLNVIDVNIKFDYIFTAETIYNLNSYDKLHSVFVNCLKDDGIVYVAAKTYYFGVGGGVRSFEDFITEKGYFNYKICWKYCNGVSREILEMCKKT